MAVSAALTIVSGTEQVLNVCLLKGCNLPTFSAHPPCHLPHQRTVLRRVFPFPPPGLCTGCAPFHKCAPSASLPLSDLTTF